MSENSGENINESEQKEGCDGCKYLYDFTEPQQTPEGLAIRCLADPESGLTVMAEDRLACEHYRWKENLDD